MAIGEAFLSAFLQVLFDRLATNEFIALLCGKNYDELFEKLKITLLTVTVLLNDAEEKQFYSLSVAKWLHMAKDAILNAEDLLDELATEALKCGLKVESQSGRDHEAWNWSRVSLTPTTSGNSSSRGVELKLKKIIERLELVAKYKDVLGLKDNDGDRKMFELARQRLETTSLVEEGCVYGRDADKEIIVETLLGVEGKCNIGVVPIIGMGGIGKTTLAQLVYNDERVVRHFELRIWVCVAEKFDAVRITKTVLGPDGSRSFDTEDLDLLQVGLRKKLDGKRFLIVFDDVWNRRSNEWDLLWRPLRSGAKGSKVIVTTRNGDVAASMGTVPAHRLRGLSSEDCWGLFTSQAFGNRANVVVPQNLKAVGEKIVEKCQGLPLAVKRFGILLRSRDREEEWEDIFNRKIWDLPDEESDILQTLKLSYLHLPSNMKQCFSFCALFPKEHEIDKDSLVAMWMAHGFLQQPKGKKRLEEVGDEYFSELISRSIFEPSIQDPSKFVVHGLMKELVDFVAGEFCFKLEEVNNGNRDMILEKARHLSYFRGKRDVLKRFEALNGVKYLRSFLPLDPIIDNIGVSSLANNVPRDLLPKLRYLRLLSFSSCRLTEVPDSIGDLKHLRYLNLSLTAIKELPESTNTLYNLQTLDLSECRYLTKLPSRIGNLKFLRSLRISGTRLKKMPLQICELKNLQNLSNFAVGKASGSRIKDLGQLSQLRGSLQISGLQNVDTFVDAMKANMKEKREIKQLVFRWNSFDDGFTEKEEVCHFPQQKDVSTRGYRSKRFPSLRETFNDYKQNSEFEENKSSEDSRYERVEMLVLEMLQPHTNIKSVAIIDYGGPIFPRWIESPSFCHIKSLKLSNCKKCVNLPALGKLPSLKDLVVQGMENVKSIGIEFYGDNEPFGSPFPSLETLKFDDMSNLEDWSSSGTQGREDFPHLQKIDIQSCPKLSKFSHSRSCDRGFLSLVELSIWACPSLNELPCDIFPSLTMLEIDGCQQLTDLPDLPSIRDIELNDCNVGALRKIPELRSLSYMRLSGIRDLSRLPPGFFENLDALEELYLADMSDLATLSDETGLHEIASLERVEISGCALLEELPLSLSRFPSLKELRVWGCPLLSSFPPTGLPLTLTGLEIKDCEALQSLPSWKKPGSSFSSLEYLMIEGCPSLASFPGDSLPDTLRELEIQDCERLQSLPTTAAVESLTISACRSLTRLHSFNITQLIVNDCPELKFLPDCLNNMANLEITDCPILQTLPELPISTLRSLGLTNCVSLESLPDRMNRLTALEALTIDGCPRVSGFPRGGLPVNLTALTVLNCDNLRPSIEWGLHRLTRLSELVYGGCKELVTFPEDWLLPISLASLELQRLPRLKRLPRGLKDLSALESFEVWDCENLPGDGNQPTMIQSFDFWDVL